MYIVCYLIIYPLYTEMYRNWMILFIIQYDEKKNPQVSFLGLSWLIKWNKNVYNLLHCALAITSWHVTVSDLREGGVYIEQRNKLDINPHPI